MPTLPYSRSTSGAGAIAELGKVLSQFGCTRFGTMTDNGTGELIVQFSFRGRDVEARASFRGYAAALLKHQGSARTPTQAAQARAMAQAQISVCSVLRDWVKGQIVAIETGVLTFEGAFLGQILLPSGRTVLHEVQAQDMLPAPSVQALQNRKDGAA